jgi:outer membrane protein TolC
MKPKNKSYKAILFIAALLCIGSLVSEVQAQDGYEPGPDVISNIPKVQERIKDGADLASDVPKGIENIGRDMIILVDRIIFGEQDPTQRLDIQPLLQDIYTALDMSPIIKKAEIAVSQGILNIEQIENSGSLSINAGGGVNYSITQNSNGSSNQGASINPNITASKRIYDFGALDLKLESERIKLKTTEINFKKANDDLFLQALSAFYEVQRALLQTRLARENLASRKTFVNFIRERMDLGASSSADVIRAEARVAAALGALSGSLESLAIARANYRKIFAKEAAPYILPREFDIEELDVDNIDEYIELNPDLELVKLNIQVAELELERLQQERFGSINSSARVARSYSESSGIFSDTLSFGLSYNTSIFDGGIADTGIQQARLNIANLQFEERRARISLKQQLEDAFSQYDGKVSAVSSKMLVLEGAKDSYNITKELYSYSRISLFEVLSAQEELFNSGKNLIDSIIDRALSKYRLLYLCNQFEEINYLGNE